MPKAIRDQAIQRVPSSGRPASEASQTPVTMMRITAGW